MPGIVTGGPQALLRLDGVSALLAATVAYSHQELGRWFYAALFLAPDLTMLGYLAGRRAGAIFYNVGHWYALPLACIAWGAFAQNPLFLASGLIWVAHIGLDRALGYGLKYASGFGFSHLGLMANQSAASGQ